MSDSINSIDIYSPTIGFSVARKDQTPLTPYTLSWSGITTDGASSDNSKEFNSASGGPAYIIPVNQIIKFTPNFDNLPANNKIIQYKWSFGDGMQNIVSSVSSEFSTGTAIFSEAVTNFAFTSSSTPLINQEVSGTGIANGTKIIAIETTGVTNIYNLYIDTPTLSASGGSVNIKTSSLISVYHIYNSGLAPTSGITTCLTATLTAIDKYQRHIRAYKQMYLKSS